MHPIPLFQTNLQLPTYQPQLAHTGLKWSNPEGCSTVSQPRPKNPRGLRCLWLVVWLVARKPHTKRGKSRTKWGCFSYDVRVCLVGWIFIGQIAMLRHKYIYIYICIHLQDIHVMSILVYDQKCYFHQTVQKKLYNIFENAVLKW